MFCITRPVVDLRRHAAALDALDFSHDAHRDSQLLFGEPVRLLRSSGPWCHVLALWQGAYPGWVHETEIAPLALPYHPNVLLISPQQDPPLPWGTLLQATDQGPTHTTVCLPTGASLQLPSTALRPWPASWDPHRFYHDALTFLDAPYLWGGCSAPYPGHICSVDCSGLVHLLYRAQGLLLPRDAKDQARIGLPGDGHRCGDLLFLHHSDRPAHHVLLALDDTTCIEAPCTGQSVRLLRWGHTLTRHGPLLHVHGRDPCPFRIRRLILYIESCTTKRVE